LISSSSRAPEAAHALFIVAVAAILCSHFLVVGVPNGSDASLHGLYQYYFSRQFWDGDLYPRWLAEANKGYGSPIFLAQYPLPYLITALLRPILSFAPTAIRESRELGIYCFLMFAGAALAARYWLRTWCAPGAATAGALLYITLPYTLGLVLYDRVGLGELGALVWIPLILALCDRADRPRFQTVSTMGIAIALLWLSNLMYVLLLLPVLVLYVLTSGTRAATTVVLGFGLSICLAATYLFPLAAYEHFFDMRAYVTHYAFAELARNMAYISSDEAQHGIFVPAVAVTLGLTVGAAVYTWRSGSGLAVRLALLLTLLLGITMLVPGLGPRLIASSGLGSSGFESFAGYSMNILFSALLTVGLALLAYCRIAGQPRDHRRESLLVIISCGALFMMLPWSAIIWRIIPGMGVIQFPWRISEILAVAAAGVFAAGLDDALRGARVLRKPSAAVILTAALVVIVAGIAVWRIDLRFRSLGTPPGEHPAIWVDPLYVAYVPGPQLAAFARRVGASTNPYQPDELVLAGGGGKSTNSGVTSTRGTQGPKGLQAMLVSGTGEASLERLGPRRLAVTARCTSECRVQIGQLYFPLWRIASSPGGPREAALGRSADGLMEVSLSPGTHIFELVYDGGIVEQTGNIVSIASIVLLLGGWLIVRVRLAMGRTPLAAR